MIDNYKQISELLEWEEDVFFFCQILKRKKDQDPSLDQRADNILIDNYYIKSPEHFEKRYPEIKDRCDMFNARAYFRLNRCYWKKVAMETLATIVEYIQKGNEHNVKSAFPTACGRRVYDKNKKWLIDLDKEDLHLLDTIKNYITWNCMPDGDKIIAEIPSKSGIHLITKPFDVREFKTKFSDIEIHKSNPTILYCP